jgi:hypothetical protein
MSCKSERGQVPMSPQKIEFDSSFEDLRLRMLAAQFPEMVRAGGEVRFTALEDEDGISGASWSMADGLFAVASETGFKLLLMELLDTFIRYRAQCHQEPRNMGVVRLGGGCISIEWLLSEEGSSG